MARKFDFRKLTGNKELMAGAVTLVAAVVLLGITALVMQKCTATPPAPSSSATIGSISTAPSEPTLVANPYNNGSFAYRDGYLSCIAGKSWLGVDVSSHQGSIAWPTVRSEGVKFAMVRLGYRGWGNGEMVADTMAIDNLEGAAAAGLQVGAYFYSQAVSVEEALQEAQFVLDMLGGRKLGMPVVFDWEIFSENGRTANVSAQTLNECTQAFCEAIQAAGYEPMVYFNLDLGNRMFDLPWLQQQGYSFWLAWYGDMTYPHRIDMWQYTDSGRVKGIETKVDLNLYFIYE